MLFWNSSISLFVFFGFFYEVKAVTHWVVTENGRIQSYMSSPLELRRPYDLIALLNQEKRWQEIHQLYNELVKRKTEFEPKFTSLENDLNLLTEIESQLVECLPSDPRKLQSIIALNGTNRIQIELDLNTNTKTYGIPFCSKHSTIDVSMPDYKHFTSLHTDTNLTLVSDDELQIYLPHPSVDLFGDAIDRYLSKNASSWVHYNLATLYWRLKGDGLKAIDCGRKALYYVDLGSRDIPLHNLAGLLHQANRSEEAALMLHSAIEYAPHEPSHYLALSYVYFTLNDFNTTLNHLGKYLDMAPSNERILNLKNTTQCLAKRSEFLLSFQEKVLKFLQNVLASVQDYNNKQRQWLRLNERLMWEHSSYDNYLENFNAERKNLIDISNLQNLFDLVENEAQKFKKHKLPGLTTNLDDLTTIYHKFPTHLFTSDKFYFDSVDWPSSDDCTKWNLPLNDNENLKLPVFLPLENKGFQIAKILSDYIDLSDGHEHKLPWYPPICEDLNVSTEKYSLNIERLSTNNDQITNDFITNYFLKYVNNGQSNEAEIGQRIVTAMEKKVAPRWVLASLASLYWRIRGNAAKSLGCLDLSFQLVPKDKSDAVLVPLASMLYQLGSDEQAMKYANLAYKINYMEPSTNFLLAILHYDNNPSKAIYYMKNVLRVDSNYYNGQAKFLLKLWSCRSVSNVYGSKKREKSNVKIKTNKISIKRQSLCSNENEQTNGNLYISSDSFSNHHDESQPYVHLQLMMKKDDTLTDTYPLSPQRCRSLLDGNWKNDYIPLWKHLISRKIEIGSFLKPVIHKGSVPYCVDTFSTSKLDASVKKILQKKFPNFVEDLIKYLKMLVGSSKYNLEDMGARVASALKENPTSWLLSNAAAIYWRINGNAEETLVCLKVALTYAPDNFKDIPLNNLASFLKRAGFIQDALNVAHLAYIANPNYVVNHFTIGEIYNTLGDVERAFTFYKSSLALDGNFEPAQNGLQIVLCNLLFETDFSEMN